ncbi:glycoside hydrolase family protein [Brevundimonas sp.]|uniref:glycoside hydrolase family protein n=1 Tax=Brevundimonas sp. TaxID=1871086 RepID=UPI0035B4AFC6
MSDTARSRLKVSREGVVLIKSFEGFRPRAVLNEEGRWTIGYGHTASAREGLTVGEQDAELLLQYDLLPVVKALNEQVAIPLNQHQFDALASFAISVGVERFLASDVFGRLNAGRASEAADALFGWPEPPAPDSALRRRAAERALFVADPESPIHLADLLVAPLPPPEGTSGPVPAEAQAPEAAVLPVEATEPSSGPWTAHEPTGAAPAARRFGPSGGGGRGPRPGFPLLKETTPAAQEDQAATAPAETGSPASASEGDFPALAEPALAMAPVEPLTAAPVAESGFPDSGSMPAGPDEPAAHSPDAMEVFGDEPQLSVLRHENEPAAPRRFDWGQTGAFVIMGVVGLGACAAAAAAFRKAMSDDSFMGDFTLIGWMLALIGLTCVGISSWSLYRRWGRPD